MAAKRNTSQRLFHIWVDDEVCKSCGLCIAICPKKILRFSERINTQGLNPMECIDHEACIGCLSCAEICPELAIQITAGGGREVKVEEVVGAAAG